MADSNVRLLTADELIPAAGLVSQVMLGGVTDEVVGAWAAMWGPDEAHGAFTDDGELVGVVRWFRDEVSVPGGALPVAAVTAVAVLPTHRRRGHLTRLIEAQLEDIVRAGVPIATLVAAEWPIYGRFGFGPAMDACSYEVDATTARFRDGPTGRIELVTPSELRPHLEAVHETRYARTAGSLRRPPMVWERMAGVERWPGDTSDAGQLRGAIWRDDAGEVQGAVSYRVTSSWNRNRPTGKAETITLVGASPEAERELWRHLCELDWVTTVVGELRAVDDPLPLFLTDGRAAAQVDRSDAVWARILDLPAVFAPRRAALAGRVVVEVTDPQGYTAGRWAIEVGPDRGIASPTDETAEVELGIDSLSAMYFGGQSGRRLAEAGWVVERSPGSVDRLAAMLATPTAPWSTTSY